MSLLFCTPGLSNIPEKIFFFFFGTYLRTSTNPVCWRGIIPISLLVILPQCFQLLDAPVLKRWSNDFLTGWWVHVRPRTRQWNTKRWWGGGAPCWIWTPFGKRKLNDPLTLFNFNSISRLSFSISVWYCCCSQPLTPLAFQMHCFPAESVPVNQEASTGKHTSTGSRNNRLQLWFLPPPEQIHQCVLKKKKKKVYPPSGWEQMTQCRCFLSSCVELIQLHIKMVESIIFCAQLKRNVICKTGY